MSSRRVAGIGVFIVGLAQAAFAQSAPDPNIKAFLSRLFVTTPTPAEIRSGVVPQLASSAAQFPSETGKLISLGIFALPLGASSAGFTYTLDKATGEQVLKSSSFGPAFAERPLTNGKGVFNVAFNYQFARFNRLGGTDVRDRGTNDRNKGIFIFDNGGIFPDYTQYFTETAYIEAQSATVTAFATYGVTDRVDVSVVLPFESLKVTGRRQQFFDVTRSFENDAQTRLDFPKGPIGVRDVIARSSRDAIGIGDVAVRGKVALSASHAGGLAVAGEARFPTGDEENLLGAGKAAARGLVVASRAVGDMLTLHANAGYQVGGVSDSFDYVGGAEFVFGNHKQITAAASVLGDLIRDANELTRLRTLESFNSASNITTTFDREIWKSATLNVIRGAAGVKWNVARTWLLNASVLFPLNKAGFQGGITPVIGLDRTWSGKR